MKLFTKAALGALMLAGATTLSAAPAAAHVTVGFGFGGYYSPPPYYAFCDEDSRYYDPIRCDDYYDGYDYYNGPVFIDGFWYNGPFRSRFHDGRREFFWHDGWHGGSHFHDDGFRHGGDFHDHGGHFEFHGGGHFGHHHH